MPWLEQQNDRLLRQWLTNTQAPMICTRPEGDILWCNRAFEKMTGYTHAELVDKKTWIELTADESDLAADRAMVDELLEGLRTDYQMQKDYKHKNGPPVRVVIDVMRYPLRGEFECFLVTALPVGEAVQFALGELSSIRQVLVQILELSNERNSEFTIRSSDVSAAIQAHPVISAVIATVLSVMLFGERVIEIIKMFGISFGAGGS
mgnify:CR=1 FL=1